ncbi:unnamed protein product [Leuciscus chuanchicus]
MSGSRAWARPGVVMNIRHTPTQERVREGKGEGEHGHRGFDLKSSLNINKLQVLKETEHRERGELLTWHIELQGHLWKWHHYISFGHGPAVLQVCSLAEMGSSSSLIFGRSFSLRLRWAVRAASGFAPGSSHQLYFRGRIEGFPPETAEEQIVELLLGYRSTGPAGFWHMKNHWSICR